MDIDNIKNTYKFLIINTKKDDFHVLKSHRQVSVLLLTTYDIQLSHMYIKRHLTETNYILINDILIKLIWA